jgi:hypothetical protein
MIWCGINLQIKKDLDNKKQIKAIIGMAILMLC